MELAPRCSAELRFAWSNFHVLLWSEHHAIFIQGFFLFFMVIVALSFIFIRKIDCKK